MNKPKAVRRKSALKNNTFFQSLIFSEIRLGSGNRRTLNKRRFHGSCSVVFHFIRAYLIKILKMFLHNCGPAEKSCALRVGGEMTVKN